MATQVPGEKPCLVLIDASGFIFRAYHAIISLSTSKGVPTNAVYGFTRMMLKTLRDLEPSHVALAFDKDSRLGRQKIDPNYKANREGPPDDLIPQFALIRRVVDVLDIPILEMEGWEADDVIGTLAAKAEAQGFSVLVVTGDKDFIQIVDEHIRLFDPMQDKHTAPEDVRQRLGIEPSQMRDYLALIGDAIDNVPKVPGIGPKTAVELIREFGDVENLLARLDEVKKPKIREALRANQETLRMAKQLVTFKTDLPVETDFHKLIRRPIKEDEARALFSELEFYKLIQEMPAPTTLPQTLAASRVEPEILRTAEALGVFLTRARTEGRLALIPAFEGLPLTSPLVGLGLAIAGGATAYLPLLHRVLGFEGLSPDALREQLLPVLAAQEMRIVGHDLKALTLLLGPLGLVLPQGADDVELLSYLLNPSRREHALTDLARERLRLELPAPFDAAQARRAGTGLADRTPEEVAFAYGGKADAALQLLEALWSEVETAGLTKLAREMEMPLVAVLSRMERTGIRVDLQALQGISRHVDAQCKTLLVKIEAQAGKAFNVNSNAQLAQVLYEELKLPVLKRNKTGPSTDADVLEKLAEQHPLPSTVLEYRTLSKLKSTYLDALGPLIDATGRVHTTYNQTGTATGRLSSSDPNLQNIPIRTEIGREIRRAFVADPGWLLISADYSQIELRLLAHVAEDPGLLDAFGKDEDVHTRTAAEVFAVSPADVLPEQRRVAKMVNFGIAYGLSAHGLSTRLKIPVEEARSVIQRYFERYGGIRRYLDETIEKARRTGSVETLFGRRRLMTDLHSRNRNVAQAAERAAINMPIQGTAADLIKLAMLKVDSELTRAGLHARMLLQVHDELLFEAPEEEATRVEQLVRECMMGVAQFKVPLKVDVGMGHSWADAH